MQPKDKVPSGAIVVPIAGLVMGTLLWIGGTGGLCIAAGTFLVGPALAIVLLYLSAARSS